MNPNKNDDANLPSQYELAHLAAVLSQTHRGTKAEDAVSDALSIWLEAGKQLNAADILTGLPRIRSKVLGKYREALKVGKHFMPRISDDFFLRDKIDFDEFLKQVVGLTETADRKKWFRHFVINWDTAAFARENPPPFESSIVSFRDITEWKLKFQRLPTQRRITDPSEGSNDIKPSIIPFEKTLRSLHNEDVKEPVLYALAFRMWRLTRKNPEEQASDFLNVNEAILRAQQ